jgi:diadenosine tetraphosphate (Ap4A) HIT family hydrolase
MKSEDLEVFKGHNYGDLLLKTKYWSILLAPDQKNLGTCVIALNRFECSLAGLKNQEWDEFSRIVKCLHVALTRTFNPTMFNWGVLMNSAYLKEPPKPHLHWHFIPRYDHKVEFEGLLFEDPCFGFSTIKASSFVRDIPENIRSKIMEKIRNEMGSCG